MFSPGSVVLNHNTREISLKKGQLFRAPGVEASAHGHCDGLGHHEDSPGKAVSMRNYLD